MDNQALVGLTADITTAFLGINLVEPSDVPGLIAGIYGALNDIPAPKDATTPNREPAVSVRASVKPDAVTCMECGWSGKMLKRHLASAHGLDEDAYRARYGLSPSHPLTAPNYSEKRRELAKAIGLGRAPNPKRGRKVKAA